MKAVTAMGTLQLLDTYDWREAQAVDQSQVELEERARTILWAFVIAVVLLFVGTVFAAWLA